MRPSPPRDAVREGCDAFLNLRDALGRNRSLMGHHLVGDLVREEIVRRFADAVFSRRDPQPGPEGFVDHQITPVDILQDDRGGEVIEDGAETLLDFDMLALDPFPFGDVLRHAKETANLAVGTEIGHARHLNVAGDAVGIIRRRLHAFHFAGERLFDNALEAGEGRFPYLFNLASDQRVGCRRVPLGVGFVGQHIAKVGVEIADGYGQGVDDQAQLLLALSDGFFRTPARRDVGRNGADPHQLPVRVIGGKLGYGAGRNIAVLVFP